VSGPRSDRGADAAGQGGAGPDPATRRVLRVGCPMWAHPPWVGRFLSPGLRGRELEEYARWCNAVEGNTTFYAIPSARTVARWAEQAPADFRFAFKVPRHITHELRLRGDEAVEVLGEFLDVLEPLGDRIGPVQVQLPPSFGPDALATLRSFVGRLPSSPAWVIEFRHPAFFDGGRAHRAVDGWLLDAGIGRVVLDTRPLHSSSPRSDAALDERRTKPRLPVVTDVMGATPIVRVIGADDLETTTAGLLAWTTQLADWIVEGREPHVFVHQPENLDSPALARMIHAEVGALVDGLAPLATPLPVAPATEVVGQTSLF
jgi:uncharacterized protein YecE (DUF72 family)